MERRYLFEKICDRRVLEEMPGSQEKVRQHKVVHLHKGVLKVVRMTPARDPKEGEIMEINILE